MADGSEYVGVFHEGIFWDGYATKMDNNGNQVKIDYKNGEVEMQNRNEYNTDEHNSLESNIIGSWRIVSSINLDLNQNEPFNRYFTYDFNKGGEGVYFYYVQSNAESLNFTWHIFSRSLAINFPNDEWNWTIENWKGSQITLYNSNHNIRRVLQKEQ